MVFISLKRHLRRGSEVLIGRLMATFGETEECNKTEEWAQYVERLEMYFEANEKKHTDC